MSSSVLLWVGESFRTRTTVRRHEFRIPSVAARITRRFYDDGVFFSLTLSHQTAFRVLLFLRREKPRKSGTSPEAFLEISFIFRAMIHKLTSRKSQKHFQNRFEFVRIVGMRKTNIRKSPLSILTDFESNKGQTFELDNFPFKVSTFFPQV